MKSRVALPALSAATRLLIVAPHPDDETIATGVLIQLVLAAGGQVRVLLLTAGDNNPWPQRWMEKRWSIGAPERNRWGRRRQEEILEALHRLGVSDDALHSMGWPDMGLTDRLMRHDGESRALIAKVIEDFRPNLVAMPSIDDRHPDHGAAHVLMRLALAELSEPPLQWTYLIHGHAGSIDGDVEFDATGMQATRKAFALQAHRTQLALSGSRMQRFASESERYKPVRSVAGPSEMVLPWRPPFWLRPWLRIHVATRQGTDSWRWRDAPLRRDEHGAYRLVGAADESPGLRFVKLSWAGHTPWIFDHWGWREV